MHEVLHLTFDGAKTPDQLDALANEIAERNSDSGGGLYRSIRFFDRICEDEDAAYEFIRERDHGDYDQLAVKFYVYPNLEPSKTLLNLRERLKKEMEKEAAYEKAHSVHTFKADFVGCPKCGSKLKKELLHRNNCPLCNSDLRGKTTLDTLARYRKNQKELKAKIQEEERKLQKKLQKHAKTKWLLKIEYHC